MESSKSSTIRSVIWFFVLTFGFSWLFWLPPVLSSMGYLSLQIPNMVWVIIGAHGPLFAAVALTAKSAGWPAVKHLIRSGFNLQIALGWWFAIISIPFIFTGIAVWVNAALSDYQPDTTMLTQPLMIIPTFLILFFSGRFFSRRVWLAGICIAETAYIVESTYGKSLAWRNLGSLALAIVLYFWSKSIVHALWNLFPARYNIQHCFYLAILGNKSQFIQRSSFSYSNQHFTFAFSTRRTKNRWKSYRTNLSTDRLCVYIGSDCCQRAFFLENQGDFKVNASVMPDASLFTALMKEISFQIMLLKLN